MHFFNLRLIVLPRPMSAVVKRHQGVLDIQCAARNLFGDLLDVRVMQKPIRGHILSHP